MISTACQTCYAHTGVKCMLNQGPGPCDKWLLRPNTCPHCGYDLTLALAEAESLSHHGDGDLVSCNGCGSDITTDVHFEKRVQVARSERAASPNSSPLKPCPFCGSEAKLYGDTHPWVQCTCIDCACEPHTETFTTEQEAIKAWNQRHGGSL